MKRWMLGLVLVGILAVGGFIWQPWRRVATPLVQRAVVNDRAGNLLVIGLDDSRTILTSAASDGLLYLQPTPSPDGKQIVYIAAESSRSRLMVQNLDGTNPRVVFEDTTSRPFYVYWSPDSRQIAFLASDSTMHLMIVPADGSAAAFEVREGQPSYFAWTPDSQQLLLHTGGIAPQGTHALYSLADKKLSVFEEQAGDFQAPAWNNGASARYVVLNDNGFNQLVRIVGTDQRALSERTADSLVFVPSPDRRQIAYLTANVQTRSGLMIANDETGEHYELPVSSPIAFFWSPDNTKIAALVIEARSRGPSGDAGIALVQHSGLSVHWEVITLASNAIVRSPTFNPSETFISLIPYFDQYAASLSLWSSDSQQVIYGTVDGVQAWNPAANTTTTLSQGTHGVWIAR